MYKPHTTIFRRIVLVSSDDHIREQYPQFQHYQQKRPPEDSTLLVRSITPCIFQVCIPSMALLLRWLILSRVYKAQHTWHVQHTGDHIFCRQSRSRRGVMRASIGSHPRKFRPCIPCVDEGSMWRDGNGAIATMANEFWKRKSRHAKRNRRIVTSNNVKGKQVRTIKSVRICLIIGL